MRLALASNEQAVYLAREVYSCGRLSARRDHPGGQCRAWSTRCSRILTCARSFSPLPLLALLCRSPLARRPKKPLPRLNRLLRTLVRLLTRPLRLLTRLLRKSLRLLRRTNLLRESAKFRGQGAWDLSRAPFPLSACGRGLPSAIRRSWPDRWLFRPDSRHRSRG